MKGPQGEDGGDAIAEINIIPLVDVVLVLLIIFMVTTVFARDKSLDLELPQGSRTASTQPPAEITVTVTKDEKIRVNGIPTEVKDIVDRVRGLKSNNEKSGKKSVLVVRGDKSVLYGKITPVLQEISYTGVSITLAVTDPGSK
jgi:biopolymer transport protein ExbD